MSKANPVDKLIPVIAAAIQEWSEQHSAAQVRTDVFKELDKSSNTILLKLLGFNTGYKGTYELDHCNGRAGNSAAGDFLRQHREAAINEWFNTVELPKLTPELTGTLQREAGNYYNTALAKAVQEGAVAKANQDAKSLMVKLTASNDIENYLKTLALISPQ